MEIVAAFIGTALVIAAVIVLEWKAGLLRDWRARHPDYPQRPLAPSPSKVIAQKRPLGLWDALGPPDRMLGEKTSVLPSRPPLPPQLPPRPLLPLVGDEAGSLQVATTATSGARWVWF
jgi:hypothetical protein